MPDEKGKLWPGDEGYPGGIFESTIDVDGKARTCRIVKDAYGNVVRMDIIDDKILGIF